MSKNRTRKSLALTAGLALVASGLTASPAFAVDSIVTGLASGTSYNSAVGYANELKLSTVMSPGLTANDGTLHYRISNPSGATLSLGLANSSQTTVVITNSGTNDGELWSYGAAAENTTDADAAETGIQTVLTDIVVVPAGNKVGEAADNNFLTVGVLDAAGATDVTVTVTSWLDTASNATNIQDVVEVAGNTVTLNFYDLANISANTALTSPVTGAASVTAVTTTTPELNGEQLGAGWLDMSFTAQGNANAVLGENTFDGTSTHGGSTYSGVTKKWTSVAYLNSSDATDAWNGTDGTSDGIAALTDNNGSASGTDEVTLAIASNVATFALFPHGLGSTNSGTFKAAITALATTTANTSAIAGTANITIVDANSFTMALTGVNQANTDVVTAGVAKLYSVGANSGVVVANGTYSATPKVGTVTLGTVGSSTNAASTADDTKAFVTATSTIAEGYNANGSSADTVEIKTGTTSVTTTATIYMTDTADLSKVKVVGAGVPVVGTIGTATGTFQINSAGVGVLTDTEYTDANGQVSFTVTTTTSASASNVVTLDITPQSIAAANAAAAQFILDWDAPVYELFDFNAGVSQPGSNASSYRSITTGGTLTYAFGLLDQWGSAAASDTWRLQLVNSGRTVSSDNHSLTNGRVSVVIADGAQGAGATITSTVNVQKLVSGTWTTQATESWDGTGFGTVVTTAVAAQTDAITLDADGAQLYGSTNADLVSAFSGAALSAQDRRQSRVLASTDANDVRINGVVTNSLTGLARSGAAVTVTGDSSILFSNGKVDSFGSITVLADVNGHFTVQAYSTKAQANSVITLKTASSVAKTQKVTFSVAGQLTGSAMSITSGVANPGSTVVITGTLTDEFGNPVDTDQISTNAAGGTLDSGDARLTVTYTGPGLLSGTLPVETGADGTFSVRILLGSNDTGNLTVTATYGSANGTISAADTGANIDLSSSLTLTIGGVVAVSASKVNAGSFLGYVAVYAKGHNGSTISWKIAGKWFKTTITSDYQVFQRKTVAVGMDVNVDIYIDSVKVLSKVVATR